MHELTLVADLMRKIGSIAAAESAPRVLAVNVEAGRPGPHLAGALSRAPSPALPAAPSPRTPGSRWWSCRRMPGIRTPRRFSWTASRSASEGGASRCAAEASHVHRADVHRDSRRRSGHRVSTVRLPPGSRAGPGRMGQQRALGGARWRWRAAGRGWTSFWYRLEREKPPHASISEPRAHASRRGRIRRFRNTPERRSGPQERTDSTGHRHLRGLPGRDPRCGESPPSVPLHQLHPMRTAVQHHRGAALRPPAHDDEGVHHVPPVSGGVRGSAEPPVPRPAERACPACGPQLELWDADGRAVATRSDALRQGVAARCGPEASSPSRGSAAFTCWSTPETRPRSAGCGGSRTGTRSRWR